MVPELCNLTGLTDVMKSDFKLMKVLQAHTLVTPEARQKAIMAFVDRINGTLRSSYLFFIFSSLMFLLFWKLVQFLPQFINLIMTVNEK